MQEGVFVRGEERWVGTILILKQFLVLTCERP